jgi:hypothetical protein
MRTSRSARGRFTLWQLQPRCVVDTAVVDLDFTRRQSRALFDGGSRPVRCAGVDHAGLMFGCGDTVRELVEDMWLKATECLKKGWSHDAPIPDTCLQNQIPVCFDLARRVAVRLALLCFMQAPGTDARKETLSTLLGMPIIKREVVILSSVRRLTGCPTHCGLHHGPKHCHRQVNLEKCESGVVGSSLRNRARRPTVHAHAQVSTPRRSATTHGSYIQTTAGRMAGRIYPVLLSLLHVSLIMRLSREGTFCRHDRVVT